MDAADLSLFRGHREDGSLGELPALFLDEVRFTVEQHPLHAGLGGSAHRRGQGVIADRGYQHGYQVGGVRLLDRGCDLRKLPPGIVLC